MEIVSRDVSGRPIDLAFVGAVPAFRRTLGDKALLPHDLADDPLRRDDLVRPGAVRTL